MDLSQVMPQNGVRAQVFLSDAEKQKLYETEIMAVAVLRALIEIAQPWREPS